MEKLGFKPRTFHMQSERSTTELHPFSQKHLWSFIITIVVTYVK